MKRTNDKIEVADTVDRVWLEKLVRIFVQLSFFFSIGLANTQFCRGIDSFALLCQLKCIPVTQSHHPIKCQPCGFAGIAGPHVSFDLWLFLVEMLERFAFLFLLSGT